MENSCPSCKPRVIVVDTTFYDIGLSSHQTWCVIKIVDPKTREETLVTISVDDGIRPGTTLADLAKLKPVFKKDGSTTAGTSSQVSDGAGAVLLMKRSLALQKGLPILGVFRTFAAVGVPPAIMGIGPTVAIPATVKAAGLEVNDIDLFEMNEAFASQFLYCQKKLETDPQKINVNGGAMTIGHPLGATCNYQNTHPFATAVNMLVLKLAGLARLAELVEAAKSTMLQDQMLVYIDILVDEDVKLTKDLKRIFSNLNHVCNERATFIKELKRLKWADNCPPMLDKTQYSSWASHMLLYIKGKEHGKLLYDSVINGPFKYRTVTVPGTQTTPVAVKDRTYDELTNAEKIHEACDIKATNIVLQGLPQDIYNLPEWSKFVTDVKLAKDLHSINFDHLYGYLRQHEAHANEVRQIRQQYPDPLALVVNTSNSSPSYTNQSQYHQQLSPIAQQYYSPPVTTAKGRQTQGYIGNGSRSNATGVNRNARNTTACQAKVVRCYNCQEEGHMARQCIKPKSPRNSAWFKENMLLAEALESGVVLDEEQMAFLADNGDTITTGQASQELATIATFQNDDLDAFDSDCDEAPSASAVLMAKLSAYDSDVLSEVPTHDTYVDNQVIDQSVQEMQYSEQPVFNNDTNIDIKSESNTISYEQYLKEIKNTVIQDTSSFVQQDALIMSVIEVDKVNKTINESLTADIEIYKDQIKIFKERQKFDLNDREKYIDSQLREVTVDRNAKVSDFQNQIHSLKLQLSATVESHKTLSTTVDVLKKESKAKKDKYYEDIIDLGKKNKALDNVIYKMGQSTQTMHMLTKPQVFYDECHKTALGYQNSLYLTQAQRKVPALYCGRTIVKQHDALSIIDTEETLELAEESRLKMHAKQNDPITKEKKVNIAPINYVSLNELSEHFVKHFVPQKQLYAKQAFWLHISKPVSETPPVQPKPVLKEIPCELPTISLVKDNF
ncbi:integrase, catalytic region, zinc finger, CCHC-type containing protein [Tanacetum coccineum]